MDDTLTASQVEALYLERERIEGFLAPAPDPNGWRKKAADRKAEIDAALLNRFFPAPKDEGVQRVEADGFAVMLDAGLTRTIDPAVLPVVLKKLPVGSEDKLIVWKPTLNLPAYRLLSDKQRAIFDECLTTKAAKPGFEIVKVEDPEE